MTVVSISVSTSDAASAILGGGLAEELAAGLSGRAIASWIVGEGLAASLGPGLARGLGLGPL